MHRLTTRVTALALLIGTMAIPAVTASATATPLTHYCSLAAISVPTTLPPVTAHTSRRAAAAMYTKYHPVVDRLGAMNVLADSRTFQMQPGELGALRNVVVDADQAVLIDWEYTQGTGASAKAYAALFARSAHQAAEYDSSAATYLALEATTCSGGGTTTTTTPTSTTTTMMFAPQALAYKRRLTTSSAEISWASSGMPGVSRAVLYMFRGLNCLTHIHTAATNYNPAQNNTGGLVTSAGHNFYALGREYSGYIVLQYKDGVIKTSCANFGMS